MYLHLGNNIEIKEDDIIGIFDMDRTTISNRCRKYLSNKEKDSKIINITQKLPKSFVVCVENDEEKVYISQISANVLFKRIKYFL